MATVTPGVKPGDRLSFTLFFATALHATLVLGIAFEAKPSPPAATTLDVTLAQFDDGVQPEQADYIAQANQIGSGELEEKVQVTAPEVAPFHDVEVNDVVPENSAPPAPVQPQPPAPSEPVVTSRSAQAPAKVLNKPEETPELVEADTPQRQPSLLERSLELASLQARIDWQRQQYAKRPRTKRLTSVSTMSSVEASYVRQLVEKIERVGTLSIPTEVKREKVWGRVRLKIAIRADGSLETVEILEGSPHKILNQAAVDVVKRSSPFGPFPAAMRKETDIYELIRTIKFQNRAFSSS